MQHTLHFSWLCCMYALYTCMCELAVRVILLYCSFYNDVQCVVVKTTIGLIFRVNKCLINRAKH